MGFIETIFYGKNLRWSSAGSRKTDHPLGASFMMGGNLIPVGRLKLC
jgi:hypothetical protein